MLPVHLLLSCMCGQIYYEIWLWRLSLNCCIIQWIQAWLFPETEQEIYEFLHLNRKTVSITHEAVRYKVEELEKSRIMWHPFKASMDCCCTYVAEEWVLTLKNSTVPEIASRLKGDIQQYVIGHDKMVTSSANQKVLKKPQCAIKLYCQRHQVKICVDESIK